VCVAVPWHPKQYVFPDYSLDLALFSSIVIDESTQYINRTDGVSISVWSLSEGGQHFLGSGEVGRFSISKESFLTLKADISKVEDCPQLSTLFHSRVSRVASNREPKISIVSPRRHLSLVSTRGRVNLPS
jgi:hypothetical protein